MGTFEIKNLSFTYPGRQAAAIHNVSLEIGSGEFVCVCGKSGCGKTTLLRLLKPALSPCGNKQGEILFEGKTIDSLDTREQASKIGFVMQNPDSQLVTDKVWHELAFGLESIGMKSGEIRVRVAEMASFFGIESWFYKEVNELSGGQKQLLNLASVMVMHPTAVILDEPLSQLDPIAAGEFLNMLYKINRELSVTVIISEHRLEEVLPLCDRVVVMEEGAVYAQGTPGRVGAFLRGHDMMRAMPAAMRIHSCTGEDKCPVSLREGRGWLLKMAEQKRLDTTMVFKDEQAVRGEVCAEIRGAYFSYGRDLPDIIRGLDLKVCRGEIFAILGGNGAGKSTTLSLISRLLKPYRGKVLINGQEVSKIKDLYGSVLGVLPQGVQSLFTEKSVYEEYQSMLTDMTEQEKAKRISQVSAMCDTEHLFDAHPFDLSGGEQQRVALSKLLLTNPQILLLDEPTKGMDAAFKERLAFILGELCRQGKTVIMVSHDIEFCAEYAHRCALFFDGKIASEGTPRELFCGNSFYTTATSKMAGDFVKGALCVGDIIKAMGEEEEKPEFKRPDIPKGGDKPSAGKKKSPLSEIETVKGNKKSMLFALLVIALMVPFTIYAGLRFFGDRKYLFTSLLIIFETLIPFALVFEKRKPRAREIVIISVLCAIAVAGRAAFYMLPQFKPVAAIVIIAGLCFGCETGFLVGAITAFVSNFLFGQGPWAPWQMLAFGLIGFLSGAVSAIRVIPKNKVSLCIFGFLATIIIYGGIMNPASVIMWQTPTTEKIVAAYVAGASFDLVHGLATAVFMWFIAEPMIEKLVRVRKKFGI